MSIGLVTPKPDGFRALGLKTLELNYSSNLDHRALDLSLGVVHANLYLL